MPDPTPPTSSPPTPAAAAARASLVVAVDGPSGAGKSTVSREVARRLGLRYLDTGAMYRAITWAVLDRGVAPDDAEAVAALLPTSGLVLGTDPDDPTVRVLGVDVREPIRGADVTAAVSAVSAIPAVRTDLVERQRALIGDGGIVVEGRDIGTTVAPGAAVKIFLTADQDVRARRRSAELAGADPSATQTDLARRDSVDAGRAVSPTATAADATVVDATDLDVDAVVAVVLALVAEQEPA